MTHIIERDFFPDLKKLKVQSEFLNAVDQVDVSKATELGMELRRLQSTPIGQDRFVGKDVIVDKKKEPFFLSSISDID